MDATPLNRSMGSAFKGRLPGFRRPCRDADRHRLTSVVLLVQQALVVVLSMPVMMILMLIVLLVLLLVLLVLVMMMIIGMIIMVIPARSPSPRPSGRGLLLPAASGTPRASWRLRPTSRDRPRPAW